MKLNGLVNHLAVGKNWKEVGCNHVVTITEISSEFADSTMVAFESECCLSSSPLEMFLKDFTPVINNDVSKSNSEIDISLDSVDDVNTTFKVGDKVYKFGDADVKTVLEVFDDGYMRISNYPHRVNHEVICYATQENYEMLLKLYPHIEFEISKEKTLAEKRYDVIKKLYDSGDIVVVRYGDYESNMIRVGILESLDSLEYPYPYTVVKNWKFAYAVDRKGIEITEDILNDID